MRNPSRPTLFAAGALLAAAMASCSPPGDPRVAAVIDHSKTAKRTYAIYSWVRVIHPDGTVSEEWGAEFNSGDLHRVETPGNRVIANCAEQTGTALVAETGRMITGPEVASVACGISTRVPFVAQTWLGVAKGPFGMVDRIQVSDAKEDRTYEVSRDGIILSSVFRTRAPGSPLSLASFVVACTDTLPDKAMFDEASLAKSFVPEVYQKAPAHPLDLSGALPPLEGGGAQSTTVRCAAG